MSTYLITEIDWHDQNKAKEYREKFGPALRSTEGRPSVPPPLR